MRLPFTIIFGFSPMTILLFAGIPFIIGFLLRRITNFWRIVPVLLAIVLTLSILIRFERIHHAIAWIELYLGVPMSYLLLGMLLGRLVNLFKK